MCVFLHGDVIVFLFVQHLVIYNNNINNNDNNGLISVHPWSGSSPDINFLVERSETHQKCAHAIDYSFSRRLTQQPLNDLIAVGFKYLVVRSSFQEVKLRQTHFMQIDTYL